MDLHRLGNGVLTATVAAQGGELRSLRDAAGVEFLWQAGPAWPRHAPILFPIVGRLRDDTLRHDGQAYRLTQHGFARDRRFEWIERTPSSCRLRLTDDATSRAVYPFAFALELAYALAADALSMTVTLANPGPASLPASVGTHPAFRWPLRDGVPKPAHRLEFAAAEPAPVRRLQGGLLLPDALPSPIHGRTLALSEALFADDALILDHPASRSVRYLADGGPSVEVAWEGFREFGIWSKPGADFLCLEPWHGMASPVGFDGEFAAKPGLLHLAPGESRTLSLRIRIG